MVYMVRVMYQVVIGRVTLVYGESNVPSCYRESNFDAAVAICGDYDGKFICLYAVYEDERFVQLILCGHKTCAYR